MLKIYVVSMLCVLFCVLSEISFAHEEFAPKPFYLSVSEYKMTAYSRQGDKISVLGVLSVYKDYETGEPGNASLIPSPDYLDFTRSMKEPFSLSIIGIVRPEGGVNIEPRCFGEWVTVTGEAGQFSGVPAVVNIISIRRVSADADSDSRNCLLDSNVR